MSKKIIAQFLLLIVIFATIISVFFIYFKQAERIKGKDIKTEKVIFSEIDNETGTLIKDINYSFSDPSGNYYELFSDEGKIDINNSDKMLMTNVKATIYLQNSSPIKIVSKYANYNKADHETNFFENVIVTHLIHKATSDNLDISFSSNIAEMYNNIIYKKPGTHLTADRLEIDLITKNSKIFMDNKSERIKIIDKK